MKQIRVHYMVETEETVSVSHLNFRPDLLDTLHELGVIELKEGCIRISDLRRVYRVMRLKNCLGVNLTGTAIILDLLDRIEELEDELRQLKE